MKTNRVLNFAAVALVIAVGSTVTGMAQAAQGPSVIGAANGIVGVSQTVEVRAPAFASQTVTLTFALAGQTVTSAQVGLNGSGSGSTSWTPSQAGSWTVSGAGTFAGAQASTPTVAGVPTITTFYAVRQAQVNVATNLTAVVSSTSGTFVPTGSVIFATAFGSALGTVALVPSGPASATATLAWTPTATSEALPLTATYSPSAGLSGAANARASSSSDQVQVLSTQPLVTLKLPNQYVVGRAANITSVITQSTTPNTGAPLAGSAAVTVDVNGTVTGIGGSLAVQGGEATTSWVPTSPGNQILTSQFSSSNSFLSGSAQQIIAVLPAPTKDAVSIGPSGQAAWAAGSSVNLQANSSVSLNSTTASGAPTSVSETGPCLVNGATLIASTTAGTCSVTVTSPGTASFAPNSTTVTVNVTAPPKKRR